MDTLKVEYTEAATGLNKVETVTFDLSLYIGDTEFKKYPFHLTTKTNTGGAKTTSRGISELVEASIVASPMNPFGATDVVFGYVADKVSPVGSSIKLQKAAATLGFNSGDVVAAIENPGAAPIKFFTISNIIDDTLVVGTVGVELFENYMIVKVMLPQAQVAAFDKDELGWGAKVLLERPLPPTVAVSPDPYSDDLLLSLTPPTTGGAFIKEYAVYVVKPTENFDLAHPVIFSNRKPDAIVTPTDLSINISTWGGGVNAGGGALSAGTYYVMAVAKDGVGTDKTVNCSKLSNIVTIVNS